MKQDGITAECRHTLTEDLGASGVTEFHRCLLCGDVLMLQPGHRWRIQAKVTEAPARIEPAASEILVLEGG